MPQAVKVKVFYPCSPTNPLAKPADMPTNEYGLFLLLRKTNAANSSSRLRSSLAPVLTQLFRLAAVPCLKILGIRFTVGLGVVAINVPKAKGKGWAKTPALAVIGHGFQRQRPTNAKTANISPMSAVFRRGATRI